MVPANTHWSIMWKLNKYFRSAGCRFPEDPVLPELKAGSHRKWCWATGPPLALLTSFLSAASTTSSWPTDRIHSARASGVRPTSLRASTTLTNCLMRSGQRLDRCLRRWSRWSPLTGRRQRPFWNTPCSGRAKRCWTFCKTCRTVWTRRALTAPSWPPLNVTSLRWCDTTGTICSIPRWVTFNFFHSRLWMLSLNNLHTKVCLKGSDQHNNPTDNPERF